MKKKKYSKNEISDPLNRDLSDLIKNSDWKKMSDFFTYRPKNKTVTLRMPEHMLLALKKIADKEQTDYQKLIREALIAYIAKKAS